MVVKTFYSQSCHYPKMTTIRGSPLSTEREQEVRGDYGGNDLNTHELSRGRVSVKSCRSFIKVKYCFDI